jgi:cytochrome c556
LVNTPDDMTNAIKSYDQFSREYKNNSELIPEWKEYYDLKAAEQLGEDLKAGNIEKVFSEDMPKIGKTCENCHREIKPWVWIHYSKDFRNIKIDTPEGPMSWSEAKMKYLVTGFDGTMINAREGQQIEANDSYKLFKLMFFNMKDKCSECHGTSQRNYYVSNDVEALIDTAGTQIANNQLDLVLGTMQQIGGTCYNCHLVHEIPQRLKELQDN